MARIFTLLSIIALVMVLLAGGITYWLSLSDLKQAAFDSLKSRAQGIATAVSSDLNFLQQSVDGAARLPSVISALENLNPAWIANAEHELETVIPHSLKIRLLPPDIEDIDQSSIPHMGFADLEMVQATLKQRQKPTIQGQGEHRHLAMTSLVKSEDQVIGVILASLQYDFLNEITQQLPVSNGQIEIKQDRIILASAGKLDTQREADDAITIPYTDWKVFFWLPPDFVIENFTIIVAAVLISGLLACLAFFIGYRKMAEFLRQDQSTIIKAAKDLMAGKLGGNYPVLLEEMNPIITTLAQYKRAVDHEGSLEPTEMDDFEDSFFEEGLDTGFLEEGLDTGFLDMARGIEVDEVSEKAADFGGHSEPVELSSESVITPFSQYTSIDSIFRAYDIRGIVDQELTSDIAYKIGQAIGSEAKSKHVKTIVIGRDGRKSSRSLSASVAEGILSTGRDILDIGLVPTPVLYFVAHHTEGRSGVMITGSHNPPEYNGMKIVLDGETLATDKIQLLKHRIEDGDMETGERGSLEENTLFSNEYIGIIADDVHIARPMKIVLDCGNGSAGELAPKLLRTIGCEVIELYCDIDGTFPNHHPDPSKPENLQDLIASVKHHEADVGIALDGDGDRLGIVDSDGNIIWPDRQMMLFAKDVLSRKPGGEIIFDVKCSRHLPDQISKFGGRPLMWKTGHSLMKAKLKQTGAPLAGEMSGHIFFNERWFGFDDGLYAAARMIEILSSDSRPSAEVFADFPNSINTPELTIAIKEDEKQRFIEQLFSQVNFPDGNIFSIDGLRVDFDDGWGLVRASNTTASLVVRFEADNKEALQRIESQFKELMLKINPELDLPF